MKKWLFNPFIYVAGGKALFIGWALMLVTAFIGFFSHTHFNGALDVHIGWASSVVIYLSEQLADWACLVLFFYIAGAAFSKSRIRLIDIAGTAALARWPLILNAIIGFGITPPRLHTIEEISRYLTPATFALAILSLLPVIWMIGLLYNAFSTSANIKGAKAILPFIGALLLAEIASLLIIHRVLAHII